MSLPDIDEVLDWRGRTVVDREGEKIGKFDELYLDEETSRPEWAAVTTGLFGRRQTLVPLVDARLVDDQLQIPFAKEQVERAPNIDPEDELSQESETTLYQHYGIEHSSAGTVLPQDAQTDAGEPQRADGEQRSGVVESAEARGGQVRDKQASRTQASGEQQPAGGADTGAETEPGRQPPGVQVGTEVRPRERIRLRKYVVTEEVTKKVPVSREEVRLEREPVDDTESGGEGQGAVSDDEQEVVLKEEEPVFGEGDRDRQG
jgi:hypothetical protein